MISAWGILSLTQYYHNISYITKRSFLHPSMRMLAPEGVALASLRSFLERYIVTKPVINTIYFIVQRPTTVASNNNSYYLIYCVWKDKSKEWNIGAIMLPYFQTLQLEFSLRFYKMITIRYHFCYILESCLISRNSLPSIS